MIEQIQGTLVERLPTFCVIDCQGVGYGLHISLKTSEALGEQLQKSVKLYTYLHVREEALQLYGFARKEEKAFFQKLLSISGVGPRLALAILSAAGPEDLVAAVQMEDVTFLTRIPGVGRKTARRLILELKEKLEAEKLFPASVPGTRPGEEEGTSSMVQDALLALQSLGYGLPEARRAVQKVMQNNGASFSLERLIKEALKEL